MSEGAMTVRELINALLDKPLNAPVMVGKGIGPVDSADTYLSTDGYQVVYISTHPGGAMALLRGEATS